MTAIRTRG